MKESNNSKPPTSRSRRLTSHTLCFLLPCSLFAGYWIDQPFSQLLVTNTVSLRGLSSRQKLNIENVAQRLNHVVIAPDHEFSFNGTVGPRDEKRGYLPAPSYVGPEAPDTMGGGICLVSSALYQDALRTGVQITQRVPHLRVTHSTPPGLDATVWYGGADLRFRNILGSPIEITTSYSPSDVTVELRGNIHRKDWRLAELSRCERRDVLNRISVLVFAKQFGKTQLVSQDMYGIPNAGVRNR
jgi:vancomycin resistance protein VanW